MCRSVSVIYLPLVALLLTSESICTGQAIEDKSSAIVGVVMEFRSGTADVPVFLCDAATGMPLAKDTYKPVDESGPQSNTTPFDIANVLSDAQGEFRFENVPAGKYRLVAQKWTGPYKGLFEEQGSVIQLMGVADDIVVPRPAAPEESRVVLSPPGRGIVQFDQAVGNDETVMFLSTAPPEFDPVLGLQAMGTAFQRNVIGLNRMPQGQTTVIGVPPTPVYAFFFAPDNYPGYATVKVTPSENGLVRVPKEPFVAGWSDGRKTPPAELAELVKALQAGEFTVQEVLEIPELSNATHEAYQTRMQQLSQDLSRVVALPSGRSVRVGDLLAADSYRRLQKR